MAESASISFHPARILIVDDHPSTAATLARVLVRLEMPIEVLTACSAEEALEVVGQAPVDILITDFILPGLNGLSLVERLRGESEPPYKVLMTAYDMPGLSVIARQMKVQDYLIKPIQPEVIREIVERALRELRPNYGSTEMVSNERPFKILIADDYPDNVRLLVTRLKNEGYEYITAEDGKSALEKARSEQPDLVLLDVNMPNMSGFEVLEELRRDPATTHIQVILITAARISPADVREGLLLGADDYVTKPIEWRELSARIRNKLRVKRVEEGLRRSNQDLQKRNRELEHEKASLTANEQKMVSQLAALNRAVQQVRMSAHPAELFQRLPCILNQELGYPAMALWLKEGNELALKTSSKDGTTAALHELATSQVLQTGQAVQVCGAVEGDAQSVAAVPVSVAGEVRGALSVYSREANAFQESDRLLLEILAAQVGNILERDLLKELPKI